MTANFDAHVRQHHRETGLADNGRDVDDAAALLIDHTLHEGAGGQEQAARANAIDASGGPGAMLAKLGERFQAGGGLHRQTAGVAAEK